VLRIWKIKNIPAAHFIKLPEEWESQLTYAYAPVGSATIHPDPHVYALRYNGRIDEGDTGFADAGWRAPITGRLLVLYGRHPDGRESLWQVVVPDDLKITFQPDRDDPEMR
jgi:hypothetical protein